MKKTILFLSAVIISITLNAQTKDAKNCKVAAYCAGKTGTFELSKSELSAVSGVTAKNDCDNQAYVVQSYEFTAKVKGKIEAYTGNSPELTSEMKKSLGSVNAGDKIYIDNVKAKYPDGSVKVVPGITIKVK